MTLDNLVGMSLETITPDALGIRQSRGFRTLTSKPGHHQTMIQTLPKTLEITHAQMVILDALRKQRNVADYSGDLVTEAAVTECIAQAKSLWTIIETKTSLLKD